MGVLWHVVAVIQILAKEVELCCATGADDAEDAVPGHGSPVADVGVVVWEEMHGKPLLERTRTEVL